MELYPISLVYEIPINENDYLRLSMDLSINRNNMPEKQQIRKMLENIFEEIKKEYSII